MPIIFKPIFTRKHDDRQWKYPKTQDFIDEEPQGEIYEYIYDILYRGLLKHHNIYKYNTKRPWN